VDTRFDPAPLLPATGDRNFRSEISCRAVFTILHLAGNVALLLWGLHMVHSGILRAFGSDLRRLLNAGLASRWKALLAGLGVTALLQSSTATGLMAASFLASGVVDLVPALAVMLGANIGTTLIVQLLTFDVSAIAPILILAGVIAFKQSGKTRNRDLGRVGSASALSSWRCISSLPPSNGGAGRPGPRSLCCAVRPSARFDLCSRAHDLGCLFQHCRGFCSPCPWRRPRSWCRNVALALVLGANLGNVIPQFLGAGKKQSGAPPGAWQSDRAWRWLPAGSAILAPDRGGSSP